jgi:predicted nucleic acid-binding protein
MTLLFMDMEIMENSWETFVDYGDKKLSLTDCSTIEFMKNRGIQNLASFDAGFDGIVTRICY